MREMRWGLRTIRAALMASVCLGAVSAHAVDGTWLAAPATSDWNTGTNWTLRHRPRWGGAHVRIHRFSTRPKCRARPRRWRLDVECGRRLADARIGMPFYHLPRAKGGDRATRSRSWRGLRAAHPRRQRGAPAAGKLSRNRARYRRRGVPAARLRAAKAFVTQQLGHRDLSAATVAAHLGVTPRYVHMLFETETRSFSEFVLAQRLALARRMLTDPRWIGRPISAIAFDAGFADLSHFNRTFRRRFGATPSEIRARTPRDGASD